MCSKLVVELEAEFVRALLGAETLSVVVLVNSASDVLVDFVMHRHVGLHIASSLDCEGHTGALTSLVLTTNQESHGITKHTLGCVLGPVIRNLVTHVKVVALHIQGVSNDCNRLLKIALSVQLYIFGFIPSNLSSQVRNIFSVVGSCESNVYIVILEIDSSSNLLVFLLFFLRMGVELF